MAIHGQIYQAKKEDVGDPDPYVLLDFDHDVPVLVQQLDWQDLDGMKIYGDLAKLGGAHVHGSSHRVTSLKKTQLECGPSEM